MRTARYVKQMADGVAADIGRSDARARPVLEAGMDPTEELARLVLAWPPRDVRLDSRYVATHGVEDTCDRFAKDVAAGAELREVRRAPGRGALVVAVDLHSNMAEFERYNSVVESHNRKWIEAGCPSDAIDAWTGDVSAVEGWVDFARASRDAPMLGEGGGPLDGVRPEAVRSAHVTVEYRVMAEFGGGWTLGFVARGRDGRALCWDESKGDDLAALVRRSIQMLYGNHGVSGDVGPLSDGLALLVQGRKSALCDRHNRRPSWMRGPVKAGVSAEYIEARVSEAASEGAHRLLGCWVAVGAIVGMVGWALHCIAQTWGDVPGPHAGMGWFLAGEATLCMVLMASSALATLAKRHAEAKRMEERFL